MEPSVFAYQVCAWLDPNAIGDALIYQQNPKKAELPAEWAWRTEVFRSARDAGLDQLIELFLDNFRVPPGYIRLLRSISRPDISSEAWQWLEDLHFSGEIKFSDFLPDSKPDTVVLVKERYVAILVLQAPLSFLCNVVSSLVQMWLPLASGGEVPRPALEHSGTTELWVYMESVIASRIVNVDAIRVAIAPVKGTMHADYRSNSYAGPYPSSLEEIEPLRDLAQSYASRWRARE